MEFENRTAIVTGGTGALGSAVAIDLLRNGARVAVTYRSSHEWESFERHLKEIAGEPRSLNLVGARVDLSQTTEVNRFVADVHTRWGRVDFVAAIAGGFAPGRSFETSEDTWDQQFNTNLRSLFLTVRAVVPLMIRQNFGRIITVSSGAILHGGGAGIAAYAVSKGAVRQLTEIVAEEVKEYDIRVHCLMPGTMDTEANRRAMAQADFSKWVKTEDVARVVRYLFSDDARALRSVTIPVLG